MSAPRGLQPRNSLGLTAHQMAILRAYAQGSTVAEIAAQRSVTEDTVRKHLYHVQQCLGLDQQAGMRRASYVMGVWDAGREQTARQLCPAYRTEPA